MLTVQQELCGAPVQLPKKFQSPEGEVLTVQLSTLKPVKTESKFQSPEGEVLTVQPNQSG